LGLTQEQLAKAVGCSASMIQKIILGKKKLPKDLAIRIMCETGLDPDQLMESFDPKAFDRNEIKKSGLDADEFIKSIEKEFMESIQNPSRANSCPEEVTKETYEALTLKNLSRPDDKRVEEQIELWSGDIRQMSKAVAQHGKFDVFRYALSRALGELRKDFDLPPPVKIIPPPASERFRALKAQSAKKPQPLPVSPGCDNGEKRSVNRSHDPSVRQSRQHV
jgi:transcriptional regulator with XRE-family HTH domain